jgi:anti-anti-sigma regulatory factor
MEKGSELAGKLMKISDLHPVVRETLIIQQQDIFFLRKQLIEQAQAIEQVTDNFLSLVNANDAM